MAAVALGLAGGPDGFRDDGPRHRLFFFAVPCALEPKVWSAVAKCEEADAELGISWQRRKRPAPLPKAEWSNLVFPAIG